MRHFMKNSTGLEYPTFFPGLSAKVLNLIIPQSIVTRIHYSSKKSQRARFDWPQLTATIK